MKLRVDIKKKEPGVFVVSPKGPVDSETYSLFEKELQSIVDAKAIILDMAKLTYITSMGLSVIFKTKQNLQAQQAVLVITHLQPNVQKVFDLLRIIPEYVFTTMDEADGYLDNFLSQINDDR